FTSAISYNLWKGRRPDCRCFGQLHPAPIGQSTLVRNGALLLIAGFVTWVGPNQPDLNRVTLSTSLSIWSFLTILFVLLVIVALAVHSWFLWNLMRQNGRFLQRIEALESHLVTGSTQSRPVSDSAPAMGLPVGSPAPAFNLPGLDDVSLSLEALRSDDKPV